MDGTAFVNAFRSIANVYSEAICISRDFDLHRAFILSGRLDVAITFVRVLRDQFLNDRHRPSPNISYRGSDLHAHDVETITLGQNEPAAVPYVTSTRELRLEPTSLTEGLQEMLDSLEYVFTQVQSYQEREEETESNHSFQPNVEFTGTSGRPR